MWYVLLSLLKLHSCVTFDEVYFVVSAGNELFKVTDNKLFSNPTVLINYLPHCQKTLIFF